MTATFPRVDPTQQRGVVRRGFDKFARTSFGRWYGIEVGSRIDPPLLKLTGGRFATTSVMPLLALRVRGRKSGELRTVPLVYFTDGEDVILIASSFGRAKHPAWYLNLRANPDVELSAGGVTAEFHCEQVPEGPERDRLYDLARVNYAGYGDYEEMAGERRIPVLRLSPR